MHIAAYDSNRKKTTTLNQQNQLFTKCKFKMIIWCGLVHNWPIDEFLPFQLTELLQKKKLQKLKVLKSIINLRNERALVSNGFNEPERLNVFIFMNITKISPSKRKTKFLKLNLHCNDAKTDFFADYSYTHSITNPFPHPNEKENLSDSHTHTHTSKPKIK